MSSNFYLSLVQGLLLLLVVERVWVRNVWSQTYLFKKWSFSIVPLAKTKQKNKMYPKN